MILYIMQHLFYGTILIALWYSPALIGKKLLAINELLPASPRQNHLLTAAYYLLLALISLINVRGIFLTQASPTNSWVAPCLLMSSILALLVHYTWFKMSVESQIEDCQERWEEDYAWLGRETW